MQTKQAVAEERARAEALERAALAKARAQAEARQKKAVAQAISKERIKGRVRRVAVAVPAIGTITAVAFEYWAYNQWSKENPDGSIQDYTQETVVLSKQVMGEVFSELPDVLKPDPEKLLQNYQWIISNIPDANANEWKLLNLEGIGIPEFSTGWLGWN